MFFGAIYVKTNSSRKMCATFNLDLNPKTYFGKHRLENNMPMYCNTALDFDNQASIFRILLYFWFFHLKLDNHFVMNPDGILHKKDGLRILSK